jgi:hypothetical protein
VFINFKVNAGKKLDNQDELQKNNHTSSDYLVSNKLQSKISEALYEKKLVICLNDYH